MKKIYLSLIAAGTAFTASAQLPSISNGNMELWAESTVTVLVSPFTFTYVAPTHFGGLDRGLHTLAAPLSMLGMDFQLKRQVFKSNEKYEGDFAAKLISLDISDTLGVFPSILVNGTINIDAAAALGALSGGGADLESVMQVTGGTPVLGRQVDSFSVYILAPAANMDNSLVTVTALRNASVGGVDTLLPVGAGSVIVDPMVGYQRITVPMTYDDPEFTMTDTFRVMVMSSTPEGPDSLSLFGVTDSNAIYVDKMEIYTSEASLGINNIKTGDLGFNLYPNPAQSFIQVNNNNKEHGALVAVYDVVGKMMHLQEVPVNGVKIDISGYANGQYFYQINNKDNTARQVGKFVKN